MKPTVYILIGLPGAGKDTWIASREMPNTVTVSSDAIREELFGSEEIQDSPDKVFNLMFHRTIDALKAEKNVIYNATNVSRKRRMNLIKEINKKVDCNFQAIVIATPYEICLQRNNYRARKVPEYVIERMYKAFQVPSIFEGFTKVETVKNWSWEDYPNLKLDLRARLSSFRNVSHDNPHHTFSIGEHNLEARNIIIQNYRKITDELNEWWYSILVEAALYHDIGKPFCKTNQKRNGKIDTIYHYYCHENVGAYDYLCLSEKSDEIKFLVSLLINLHMIFYGDEIYRQRIYELYNDINFQLALKWLNYADKNAH